MGPQVFGIGIKAQMPNKQCYHHVKPPPRRYRLHRRLVQWHASLLPKIGPRDLSGYGRGQGIRIGRRGMEPDVGEDAGGHLTHELAVPVVARLP